MAVGDTVAANNATSGSGTFTIQPSAGVEWDIHNLYVSGACNVIKFDGSTSVTIYSLTTGGTIPCTIHVTNTVYLKITDTSSSTNDMGYDGVQTK
jgi:hypothetical protein